MRRRFDRLMRRKSRYVDVPGPEYLDPLAILHDGAIGADRVGDGRIFPALVIDTAGRGDVEDVMKAHQHPELAPGEVRTTWGSISREPCVVDLLLEFQSPIATTAILRFPLRRYGGFVDQIVRTKGLLLFSGSEGDRVSERFQASGSRILIEVGSDFPEWDSVLVECLEREARERGLKRKEARGYAEAVIREWRGLFDWRFPRR